MPARVSEAFVLQTWPFREGDLIVSFLYARSGQAAGSGARGETAEERFWLGTGASFTDEDVLLPEGKPGAGEISTPVSLVQCQFRAFAIFQLRVRAGFFRRSFRTAAARRGAGREILPAADRRSRISAFGRTRRCVAWRDLLQPLGRQLAGLLPDIACVPRLRSVAGRSENPTKRFFSRLSAGLHCEDCRRAAAISATPGNFRRNRAAIAEEILRLPSAS